MVVAAAAAVVVVEVVAAAAVVVVVVEVVVVRSRSNRSSNLFNFPFILCSGRRGCKNKNCLAEVYNSLYCA